MKPDASSPQTNPELAAVDADIRAYYEADLGGRYVPGVPIKIQIVRLLRKLAGESNDGQQGAKHGEGTKDEVEPKNPGGQLGRSPGVPVDGLGEALGKHSDQSALDLLMQLRSLLSVASECLGDFCRRQVNVSTATCVSGWGGHSGTLTTESGPASGNKEAA